MSANGAMQDAYLRITDVTKKFGEFTALKGISLDILPGEFVCFLGPSGCGKTTLLRAIAGLDIQSTGTIEQAGRDISALPPEQRDFGIVFQSYALFPNLTIRRNVGYGLENQGKSRKDINARVDELLELVGLSDQADKYPAQLSGGQQQRVALARALATSPGLILLDEPLSALDAKVRGHLRHEIKELQAKLGVTTIMVTHDQEEALTMADRIVVMNQGFIEQVGTPEEIYGQPASPFVADFIGTMNFLPATVNGTNRAVIGGIGFECDSEGYGDGDAVTLAVRPEEVVLHTQGANTPNTFEARVDEVEFLGPHMRLTLGSAGMSGEHLRVDVSAQRAREMDTVQGKLVAAELPRNRIRVYPRAVA
ncbi:MAG: putative 2-aminoethylphosphonate ABC transporter ATP-binding protein [Geminicoccaceae bacterium]